MTGRRVLSLVVGLWTASAVAQNVVTVTATRSIALDGGLGLARAYVVTGGMPLGTEYAIANAGGAMQMFDLATYGEVTRQGGIFTSFAVADFLPIGTGTTTLVVAADVGPSCLSTTVCLDIFYWDPVGGFVIQNSALTSVNNVTAMAIDATSSPIRIFFATQSPSALYEQDITINAMGAVTVSGVPVGIPVPPQMSGLLVEGLTVDGLSAVLYASDSASTLYKFPEDGGAGVVYTQVVDGGYSQVLGLSFFPFPIPPSGVVTTGNPYILGGSGLIQGVYNLNPNGSSAKSIVNGSAIVLSQDTGRTIEPTGASVDGYASLTLLTEDLVTADAGGVPWLHVIADLNLFPDGGPPDAGSDAGVTDAGVVDAGLDAGGIPTIPVIAPGPGALPQSTNSCNCSSAGSAPVLLALLLPLIVPRRRR